MLFGSQFVPSPANTNLSSVLKVRYPLPLFSLFQLVVVNLTYYQELKRGRRQLAVFQENEHADKEERKAMEVGVSSEEINEVSNDRMQV